MSTVNTDSVAHILLPTWNTAQHIC